MERLEAETADKDTLLLWIAFDYGGRAEIVDAARRLVADGVAPDERRRGRLRRAHLYAPDLPDPGPADPHLRRAPRSRTSSSGSSPTPSSSSSTRSGPTSATRELRQAVYRLREPAPAVRRRDEPVRLARCSSTIVGVPIVLGLVWLGGWWLFGLALFAALVALHELYVDGAGAAAARPRRLRRRARDAARRAARRAAVDARRLRLDARCSPSCSTASPRRASRPPSTISSTVLGTAWIALGLGHLLLLRVDPRARPPDRLHGAARRLRGRHGRLPRRPSDRPAQARAVALARARPGRASSPARWRRSRSRSSRSTRSARRSSRSGRRSCSAA